MSDQNLSWSDMMSDQFQIIIMHTVGIVLNKDFLPFLSPSNTQELFTTLKTNAFYSSHHLCVCHSVHPQKISAMTTKYAVQFSMQVQLDTTTRFNGLNFQVKSLFSSYDVICSP